MHTQQHLQTSIKRLLVQMGQSIVRAVFAGDEGGAKSPNSHVKRVLKLSSASFNIANLISQT